MYGSKDVKFTNLARLIVNDYRSFQQIQPVAACIIKTYNVHSIYSRIYRAEGSQLKAPLLTMDRRAV